MLLSIRCPMLTMSQFCAWLLSSKPFVTYRLVQKKLLDENHQRCFVVSHPFLRTILNVRDAIQNQPVQIDSSMYARACSRGTIVTLPLSERFVPVDFLNPSFIFFYLVTYLLPFHTNGWNRSRKFHWITCWELNIKRWCQEKIPGSAPRCATKPIPKALFLVDLTLHYSGILLCRLQLALWQVRR